LIVVTVPWNIHFRAKEVVGDGEQSSERGIRVDHKQLSFAKAWVARSLYIALGLHFVSAIVLYVLAVNGIGTIGYWGAVAALLLTVLRPIVSAYEYLIGRLQQIGEQVRYPREDVQEVRMRLAEMENSVAELNRQLDRGNSYSLVARQEEFMADTRRQLAVISAQLEDVRAVNQRELERISHESKQAISQLTVDGQFLDHVREIIRFFKSA
jgi:hypothetical protein